MWKRSLLAMALGATSGVAGLWAQEPELPAGPMRDTTRVACLFCHDASIIIQQKLTREDWTRVVNKMVRWGAPLGEENLDAMISYLAQNLAPPLPRRAPSELGHGAAADKIRMGCLFCHNADIIVQQQLDPTAWKRTVEKMIGWGAAVSPDDRKAIIHYLMTNFPPDPRPSDKQD